MNNRVSELEAEKEELQSKLQSLHEIKTQNGKNKQKPTLLAKKEPKTHLFYFSIADGSKLKRQR